MDYPEALRMLNGRDSRRMPGRATYLVRINISTIGLRYHGTYVVRWFACGRVQIASGGWDTVTTRQRINYYSPLTVWRHRGVSYVAWGHPSANGWTRDTLFVGQQDWKEGRLL